MKGSRPLVILLIVFIALAALLVIQNAQNTPASQSSNVCSNCVFADLQLDDIQAIRLRSPETGKIFMLVRVQDGTWTAPDISGTLDASAAENIARTMVVLPFAQTLPRTSNDDMTVYGFTPEGVLAIEIVQTNGMSHAVAVGYRTPTEDSYYALVDDRSDLYLLERAPIDYLIAQLKSPPVA